MGRVVKNARVVQQRYQVGVPRIEPDGTHGYDDAHAYHAWGVGKVNPANKIPEVARTSSFFMVVSLRNSMAP